MKKTLFLTIAFVLGWLTLAMAQLWVNPQTRNLTPRFVRVVSVTP